MTRRALVIPLALPLVFTAIVLALVAYNRGGVQGLIVLSDREAYVPPRTDDRSATTARLTWCDVSRPGGWFGRDKLEELGFDLADLDPAAPRVERYYLRQVLPRAVWVAFTIGDNSACDPSGQARALSRLVPVDVARDAATLAARYPDGRTHLITAAVVRPLFLGEAAGGPGVWVGSIMNIAPASLHVPRDLAARLEPPFTFALAYGRRREPWVVVVTRGDASQ